VPAAATSSSSTVRAGAGSSSLKAWASRPFDDGPKSEGGSSRHAAAPFCFEETRSQARFEGTEISWPIWGDRSEGLVKEKEP
jgi:hypothetical protein